MYLGGFTRYLFLLILSTISAAWLFAAYQWAESVSIANQAIVNQLESRYAESTARIEDLEVLVKRNKRELGEVHTRITLQKEEFRSMIRAVDTQLRSALELETGIDYDNVSEKKSRFFLLPLKREPFGRYG